MESLGARAPNPQSREPDLHNTTELGTRGKKIKKVDYCLGVVDMGCCSWDVDSSRDRLMLAVVDMDE